MLTQIFLTFVFNTILKMYVQLRINQMEVQRLNSMEKNIVTLPCAICKEQNTTYVHMNTTNDFRCQKCNTLNTISITLNTIQKTEFNQPAILTDEYVMKCIKKEEESKNGISR